MRLAEETWTDVHEGDGTVAFLPVGSTEQHGPHDPLGTDHLTATAIAEGAAAAAEESIVVAPPIPVGISEEHRQFTGTLWVSPDTFRSYVRETIESMLEHGWDRVVVVNGHGGNAAAIEEVTATLTRRTDAVVVPFTWFDAVETDLSLGHAGPVETSLLLRVAPELVHEDRFEEAADGGAERWGEWTSGVNLAPDSASFTENGTVGDPGEASAATGEALERRAIEALLGLVEAVRDRDPTPPPHR
ncbi:MAG: creatininase family protein [Halanaeroarchaeum sp.]